MKTMIIAATLATSLATMTIAAQAHRTTPPDRPAQVKTDFSKTLFDKLQREGR